MHHQNARKRRKEDEEFEGNESALGEEVETGKNDMDTSMHSSVSSQTNHASSNRAPQQAVHGHFACRDGSTTNFASQANIVKKFIPACPEYSSERAAQLKTLREDGLFVDVSISIGRKVYKAHKAVLVAGSNFFRALFCSDLMESRAEMVELHDVDQSGFEVL
jgi:hypothetical protein